MEPMSIVYLILMGVGGLFGLFVLLTVIFSSFFTNKTQEVKIIENFGHFSKVVKTGGLKVKWPWPIGSIAYEGDLRIHPLEVPTDTKTKDDVPVSLRIAVQYYMLSDRVYEALYKLNDPETQIRQYVEDVVRAQVPNMDLDEVFANKDEIASAIRAQLEESMDDFGYGIQRALVVDINWDEGVKAAMAQKQTDKRLREAMEEKAQGEYIQRVKAAEAAKQEQILDAEGYAESRKLIAASFAQAVDELEGEDGETGMSHREMTNTILTLNYLQTMEKLGTTGDSKVIFMPQNPGAVSGFQEELARTLIAGNEASKEGKDSKAS